MRRIKPSTAASSRLLARRKANAADLDFICGVIVAGARKGHYAFNAEHSLHVRCMKEEMQSIVARGSLLDRRRGTATVYSLNNRRVAVLITSEAEPGGGCLEIYALSVARKYQRRGYGSLILDDLINRCPNTDIYARCSTVSRRMYGLLADRCFELIGTDGDFRVLKRNGVPSLTLVSACN